MWILWYPYVCKATYQQLVPDPGHLNSLLQAPVIYLVLPNLDNQDNKGKGRTQTVRYSYVTFEQNFYEILTNINIIHKKNEKWKWWNA